MNNPFIQRQMELRQRMISGFSGILVSSDEVQKGEDDLELEKAHKDGDMHPNGKWVWVSSANGGKGDWRTAGGRTHQKHTAAQGGSGSSGSQGTSGGSNGTPKAEKPGQQTSIDSIPDKEFKSIVHTLEKVNPNNNDAAKHLEEEAMNDEQLKNFIACADHFKNSSKINKLTRDYCAKWSELAHEELKSRKGSKASGGKSNLSAMQQHLVDKFDKTGKVDSVDALVAVLKSGDTNKRLKASQAFRKTVMAIDYIDADDYKKTLQQYSKGRTAAKNEGDKERMIAYDVAYNAIKDKMAKVAAQGSKSALDKLSDDDPEAYENIAQSTDVKWLEDQAKSDDKIYADAAKERIAELKKKGGTKKAINLTPDNAGEYEKKLNAVLDKKGYFAHATKGGSIEIYKKGDRMAMKNLKAAVASSDYIDWGPNEKTLKPTLESVIKSVFTDSGNASTAATATTASTAKAATTAKTDDLSSTKINLSVKDFDKMESDDEYGDYKDAPLKLHDYVGKMVEYYDEDGKKQKATPFINEFYASSKQDKVGGYEIRFNRADAIGSFKTLNEAVTALNDWMNKMRVPGHGKPKWIYNAKKGDHQMNYSL